jgi:uncharacterized zinc-type alcohol dehydrogenase-like protein
MKELMLTANAYAATAATEPLSPKTINRRDLGPDDVLVSLGLAAEPLSLKVFSVLHGRRSFAGSIVGGIGETQEMPDFCAGHHLGAEVEVIGADQINQAYDRVLASDVRYRFVIDTSTLR